MGRFGSNSNPPKLKDFKLIIPSPVNAISPSATRPPTTHLVSELPSLLFDILSPKVLFERAGYLYPIGIIMSTKKPPHWVVCCLVVGVGHDKDRVAIVIEC